MNFVNKYLPFALLAVATLPVASLHAAADASDVASNSTYSGGDYNGLNGGTGFGSYVLVNSTNNSSNGGTFIGDSTANANGSGGINTGGKAFGLYSNSGTTNITRSFTAGGSNASTALASGQVFSLAFDNGYINNGSSVGVSLLNASGTAEVTFQFTGGNSHYTYSAGTTSNADTGINYTGNGLTLGLTEGANNAFTLVITSNDGGTATFTGTANDSISQFQVFNNAAGSGANYDAYFNSPNISEVPEASEWAMMAGFLGLLGFRWSRRAGLV